MKKILEFKLKTKLPSLQLETNILFNKILNNEKVILSESKKKTYEFVINLFGFLNRLSIENDLIFILEITTPIYNQKENIIVDYDSEKFHFNKGLKKLKYKSSILKNYKKFFDELTSLNGITANQVFYDCLIPENIDGYKLIEVDQDLWKYIPINEIDINNLNKSTHFVHYLKWNISEDISIRFFYKFDDHEHKENSFFIKSHSEKYYIPISKEQAKHMIIDLSLNSPSEFVGYSDGTNYKKIIITDNHPEIIIEDYN